MKQAQVKETAALIQSVIGKTVVSGLANEIEQKGIPPSQRVQHMPTDARAGFSGVGYGKSMAKDYADGMVKQGSTWAKDVLQLLKVATDKQRDEAMKSASEYADTLEDETIASSLKKRITETRRVFKYALVAYDDCRKLMESKSGWHLKVTSCPTQSTKGRKKGQGAGKSTAPVIETTAPAVLAKTTIADAVIQAEKTDSNIPQKHSFRSPAEMEKDFRNLSIEGKLKFLDYALFALSEQKLDVNIAALAKACMGLKDKHDAMVLKAKAA